MIADIRPAPTAPTSEVLAVDQCEAARLTGLSAKTLGRLADAGEPLGRLKIGRRVLYYLPTLTTWLASRAVPSAAEGTR